MVLPSGLRAEVRRAGGHVPLSFWTSAAFIVRAEIGGLSRVWGRRPTALGRFGLSWTHPIFQNWLLNTELLPTVHAAVLLTSYNGSEPPRPLTRIPQLNRHPRTPDHLVLGGPIIVPSISLQHHAPMDRTPTSDLTHSKAGTLTDRETTRMDLSPPG
jgi:hypothetical protein